MIKTTQKVVDIIIEGVLLKKNMGDKEMCQLLKEWGDSIVEECAGSFECTMETWDEYDEETGGMKQTPVLIRQSVLNVKEQIK